MRLQHFLLPLCSCSHYVLLPHEKLLEFSGHWACLLETSGYRPLLTYFQVVQIKLVFLFRVSGTNHTKRGIGVETPRLKSIWWGYEDAEVYVCKLILNLFFHVSKSAFWHISQSAQVYIYTVPLLFIETIFSRPASLVFKTSGWASR